MEELYGFVEKSSFSLKIVDIKWERVQLIIALSLKDSDLNDIEYYLYEPETEKEVRFKHIEKAESSLKLRMNMIVSWEEQSPVPSGRWILIGKKKTGEMGVSTVERSLLDPEPLHHDKFMNPFNMDHYRKTFKKSKSNSYNIRPLADDETGLFCLDIHLKGAGPTKTKRQIRKEKRRKNRNARNLRLRQKMFTGIFNSAQKLFGIKENRILFTSDSRPKLGGNMEFVYNKMVERGLDKKFTIKMLFKTNITDRRKFLDKFRLPFYLATSKTILVDDFHPLLYTLDFDKKQNIIQLWHASGPFKTVGYSRLGKPGGPSIHGGSHKIYTSAIVGSEHSIPFYAEAFGMNEEDVYPTGIPRMDPFFDEEYKEKVKNKMYREFPQTKAADKVILFAPTFRGTGPKTAYYPINRIDLDLLAEYARKFNAVVIFKFHPFVRENIKIPEKNRDIFIDAFDYREINDILHITDLLITDYSSVVFEYSLLNKPMVFYGFDLRRYILSRDFYEGFEDFVPGKIVRTFDELIESLKNEDFEIEKVQVFRDKYFKYQDSGSSDRVIDWLILDNFPDDIPKGQKQKLLNK